MKQVACAERGGAMWKQLPPPPQLYFSVAPSESKRIGQSNTYALIRPSKKLICRGLPPSRKTNPGVARVVPIDAEDAVSLAYIGSNCYTRTSRALIVGAVTLVSVAAAVNERDWNVATC